MVWLKKDFSLSWLLAFVGGKGDEEELVENYLETASLRTKLPHPKYRIERIDTSKTLAFPTGIPVDHELSEKFDEDIVNDLLKKKQKYRAAKAALIIARNAFPDEDVFREIVKYSAKDIPFYHMICTWTDFLHGSTKRKKCYEYSCAQCGKLEVGCAHSCLPRLLWLMFGEDERVLNMFK